MSDDTEHRAPAWYRDEYAKKLKARKKRQFANGKKDAIARRPPVMDELAYIQGYEEGLKEASKKP
jgi:hypothetical protein